MQKSRMFQGSLMYDVEVPVLWYRNRYESGPVDGAGSCRVAYAVKAPGKVQRSANFGRQLVFTCYAHSNPFAQHLAGKKGCEHVVRVQKEVINLIW